jgi:hypothetical protein
MPDIPDSDLYRTKTHEPNTDFPEVVELRLVWNIAGKRRIRVMKITADEFFGHGSCGAPISPDSLVHHIERMRRKGPPEA